MPIGLGSSIGIGAGAAGFDALSQLFGGGPDTKGAKALGNQLLNTQPDTANINKLIQMFMQTTGPGREQAGRTAASRVGLDSGIGAGFQLSQENQSVKEMLTRLFQGELGRVSQQRQQGGNILAQALLR